MSKDKVLENEFKNRLKKETQEATRLKEETWNNISRELFPSKIKKTRTNWMKGFAATLGTVAVVVIMLFVFVTEDFTDETQNDSMQGINDPDTEGDDGVEDIEDDTEDPEQALLKDRFVHEKQVEVELEGMKEPIQVQLATNEELKYIIYVDKDRYRFIQGEEIDEIVLIDELDDRYPEVGMEIQHITGLTIEEVTVNIKESLANDGMSIVLEESVNWPIDAVMIEGQGAEGDQVQWDTPVHRYYITVGENDSFFVFKHKFFVEAWEGLATRFDWMLESFEVVQ